MEATGETLMCAGCMDIVTLIHDETNVVEPRMAKVVMETMRMASVATNKVVISDDELAVFLIILGGSLLVWESA
jgi:hypothetical protein